MANQLFRDWKKLTFYYFADAYINFNSLVTDLFKVYKTRIWMSAINPASFATPSLGLQAPSGIGPGAVGVNRSTQVERRTQHDPVSYSNGSQGMRGYAGGVGNTFGALADPQTSPGAYQTANYASYGYAAFANPRNSGSMTGFPSMDAYTTFPTQSDYQSMPQRFGQNGGQNPIDQSRQENNSLPGSDAWVNSLQSLSLNSR